jgi:hypothetical protein
MSDDFWSSQAIRDFIIGMSGGLAGAISSRKIIIREIFRHVMVGGMAAVIVGPAISIYYGTPYAATVWFTGVVGVGLCQGAILLVSVGSKAMSKRLKND